VLFSAGVLFVAVIVGGLLSAWIARGAIKGLISRGDREQKASAIAALVDAAPGHVAAVRRHMIDRLTPEQLSVLEQIGTVIIEAQEGSPECVQARDELLDYRHD